MIALAFEIYFGVKAFKNGWRWRVLWPIGIAVLAGALMGLGTGLNGDSMLDHLPLMLVVDIAVIVVLAVMAQRPPIADAPVSRAAASAPPVA